MAEGVIAQCALCAARRHLSFSTDCFPEPPQNLTLFPIISLLTVIGF